MRHFRPAFFESSPAISRREVLIWMGGTLAAVACRPSGEINMSAHEKENLSTHAGELEANAAAERVDSNETVNKNAARTDRLPTLFLAHGAPMLIDDAVWVGELSRWSASLPRPRALLVLSAHWEERPVTIGATTTRPLIYDFYGFPERYYQMKYPSPGAPELASRVKTLLQGSGPVMDAPTRGLDHGVYVPLLAMYPQADIPVLQVSLPTQEPRVLLELGRKLAPLRDEGVLIIGSGQLTHNLRAADFRPQAPTPAWAAEFDAWCRDVLDRQDIDALMVYREKAPGVRQSLPTHEHFIPLMVALGAALETPGAPRYPVNGWLAGSLTKRSVQFG